MLDWIRIAIGVLTAYPTQEAKWRRNAAITLGRNLPPESRRKNVSVTMFGKKELLFWCVAQRPHFASMTPTVARPALAKSC
jgi:hypothetical protein